MRVLFAIGAGERAGAESVLLALLRNLPAHGVEPVVAALADGPFLDELAGHGIRTVRVAGLPRARHFWRSADVADRLAHVARLEDASVVQANGEKMAIYAGPAARRAGAAHVVWLHDSPATSVRSTAVQLMMALAPHDAFVAPSAWMARTFRRRLGVRSHVIPHGVDVGTPRPVDVRRLLGWPDDAVVVAHFGRLQRWKGAEDFLRAAAHVAPHRPEARFVLVGGALFGLEVEYAKQLPALASQLGIADRVRFLGHRTDALSVMAGCDVVVHCSRRPEPFGMVVLEAMALGRAVVAAGEGAPPEMVRPGDTGLLAPPRRPIDLAATLDEVIADPALRARLGTAAAAEVAEQWTADRMAERFAALYRGLRPAWLEEAS